METKFKPGDLIQNDGHSKGRVIAVEGSFYKIIWNKVSGEAPSKAIQFKLFDSIVIDHFYEKAHG